MRKVDNREKKVIKKRGGEINRIMWEIVATNVGGGGQKKIMNKAILYLLMREGNLMPLLRAILMGRTADYRFFTRIHYTRG